MIKTDVPNYYRSAPGVVIHQDAEGKKQYLNQKRILDENKLMKEHINNMQAELQELKNIVQKLINKE
jgi:hypothetical protein